MNEIFKPDSSYASFILDIKQRIQQAQIKASVAVNHGLIELYWYIGSQIVEKQKSASWGDGFLQQMSKELCEEFPQIKGFSLRNLQFIRQWFTFWTVKQGNPIAKQLVSQLSAPTKSQQAVDRLDSSEKWQQPVAILSDVPWGHNLIIISKAKNHEEALFYAQKTIENNWSRAVLTHQIESGLYERSGKAINNFELTLPKPESDLAKQMLKDPYNFDFLTMTEKYNERDLENALTEQLSKFLLELGSGFAFIGRQYKITVEDEDFYIDLLFYHTKLHCYVVVELKAVKFQPEFAGKLNFYISAVNSLIKSKEDKPTIGLLICKEKKNTVVEYALSEVKTPIGVSEYELSKALPDEYKSSLPSIEEIEAELEGGAK
jgi:predicted nuclease of restriction endonuclease-like (RecB) superfamily